MREACPGASVTCHIGSTSLCSSRKVEITFRWAMTCPLLAAGLNTRCRSLFGIGDHRTIPALEAIRPNLRECVHAVLGAIGVRLLSAATPSLGERWNVAVALGGLTWNVCK